MTEPVLGSTDILSVESNGLLSNTSTPLYVNVAGIEPQLICAVNWLIDWVFVS